MTSAPQYLVRVYNKEKRSNEKIAERDIWRHLISSYLSSLTYTQLTLEKKT